MRNANSSTLSLPQRPESRTRSTSTPNNLNEKVPMNGRRLSTRPSLPDVTTASPTYTGGRNVSSYSVVGQTSLLILYSSLQNSSCRIPSTGMLCNPNQFLKDPLHFRNSPCF